MYGQFLYYVEINPAESALKNLYLERNSFYLLKDGPALDQCFYIIWKFAVGGMFYIYIWPHIESDY